MAMQEASVFNDETKGAHFGDAYKTALSNSIDPVVTARTKGWSIGERDQFRDNLVSFVDGYIKDEKTIAKAMLDVSKNPATSVNILEFERTGDAREIARKFLPAFKAAVARIDPNIEVKMEMTDNWITITATNKQIPQPKVPEAVATGPIGDGAVVFNNKEAGEINAAVGRAVKDAYPKAIIAFQNSLPWAHKELGNNIASDRDFANTVIVTIVETVNLPGESQQICKFPQKDTAEKFAAALQDCLPSNLKNTLQIVANENGEIFVHNTAKA